MKRQMNTIKSRNSTKLLFSPSYSTKGESVKVKKMMLHYCADSDITEEPVEVEEPTQEAVDEAVAAKEATETPSLSQAKPGSLDKVWIADGVLTGVKPLDSKGWEMQ